MSFFKNWNIKRYLLTYTLKSMPIVYILLLGIMLILIYPISFAENSSAWIGGYILAPILCAFVLKNILKDVFVVNRQWQALEQQGKLEEMLEDYRNSEKEIGGNIRVGQKYLFGKGSMRVLAYSDIVHIFMVNAERKGKIARDLRCEDKAGQEFFVCQLDPMGQSHLDLDKLYLLIEKKNPSAKTGM
jgi:hypothetical protein